MIRNNTGLLVIGLLLTLVAIVTAFALLLRRHYRAQPNPAVPADWPAAETYGRTGEFPVLVDGRSMEERTAEIQKELDKVKERVFS